MALDILEFFDESGSVMVSRMPEHGSGEFRLGSQLIVQESQVAAFFRDGRCLDMFEAGRHTLATQNLPLVARLIASPFGGKSPFRAYVYFVATKTFVNLGWGTASPVLFRDAELRMVSLRGYGSYSIRVRDPRVFLMSIVGTRGIETTGALQDFFRAAIVSKLNEAIGTQMKSILDLPRLYSSIGLATKQAVRADFEQYGVELTDLIIESITVPPDVQTMIDRASGIAAQDGEKYRVISAADAMRDAASVGAGGALGAGIAVGAGLALGQELAGQLRSTAAGPAATGPAGTPRLPMDDVNSKLRALRQWKEEGLITDSDYEEQKRRLLIQL